MILTAKEIREGQISPPWFYGFAYYEFFAEKQIWYPIPFNIIVGKWRWIKIRWDVWRRKEDRITLRIRRIAKFTSRKVYRRGYDNGYEFALRVFYASSRAQERKGER